MSAASLRAAIKALLDQVPSIGLTHDYERWSVRPDQYLERYKDPATGRIFGWEVTRRAFRTEAVDDYTLRVRHTFVLKGYLGLQDASATEKLFEAAIEAVLAKFAASEIPGACAKPRPLMRAETIEARTFGGVLCHYAELVLEPVCEIIDPAQTSGLDDFARFYADWALEESANDADATDHVDLEVDG